MTDSDWERYVTDCRSMYREAFSRFADILISGSAVATPMSAPVYLGSLTAVLVTVCTGLTDHLKLYYENSGTEISDRQAAGKEFKNAVRKSYFECLSNVQGMDIAGEYFRTRISHLRPDEESMASWLLSFNGREAEAGALAARAVDETDRFVHSRMPEIVKMIL